MNNYQIKSTVSRGLITLSAASLLLASQAFAQDQSQAASATERQHSEQQRLLGETNQQTLGEENQPGMAGAADGAQESDEPAVGAAGTDSEQDALWSDQGASIDDEATDLSRDGQVGATGTGQAGMGAGAGDGSGMESAGTQSAEEIETEGAMSSTADYEEFNQGAEQRESLGAAGQSGAALDEDEPELSDAAAQGNDGMGSDAALSDDSQSGAEGGAMSSADYETSPAADVNAASEPTGQPQISAAPDQSDVHEGSQDLMQASVDSIRDRNVVNSAGEKIGEVNEVVINNQTGEVGLVVSGGGMLGIGATQILAPVNALSVSGDDLVWDTQQNRKQLRDAHEYNSDNFEEVSEDELTLGEVGNQEGLSAVTE